MGGTCGQVVHGVERGDALSHQCSREASAWAHTGSMYRKGLREKGDSGAEGQTHEKSIVCEEDSVVHRQERVSLCSTGCYRGMYKRDSRMAKHAELWCMRGKICRAVSMF